MRKLLSLVMLAVVVGSFLTGCSGLNGNSNEDIVPEKGFYYDKIDTGTQVCDNETDVDITEELSSESLEIPEELKELLTESVMRIGKLHRNCIYPIRPIGIRKWF